MTRRDLLKTSAILGAGAAIRPSMAQAQALVAADPLAAARAQMAATPIVSTRLMNIMTMLAGPGGNVIVLHGLDGKVVIDTFVQGAFAGLKQRLDAMGSEPILYAIDTHWHFDHADNNESFHNAGATLIAHANTSKRLSEPHDLLGMHFNPAPAAALPAETFAQTHQLKLNNEYIDLGYFQPAHTDTDIYVQFVLAEVLHLGDTFFNGMYPFIDVGTGGNINGMIAAADQGLRMAGPRAKIVPGHGALADREALMKYRDMLVMVRDRIEKLKRSGRTEKEAVAAKPTADLDPAWGNGFVKPDAFVTIVYNTL
jgi:glyoxylase-like metal-dependent hydrolase (beta-lactamase superfamily II)